MSLRSNGKNLCDRCGWDVENADVYHCAIMSTATEDFGLPIIYHFCRDHELNGKRVSGCVNRVLTKKNLENYLGEGG